MDTNVAQPTDIPMGSPEATASPQLSRRCGRIYNI